MLKDITASQSLYCKSCCYRDKTLDNIVFCPYSNKCRKTGKPAEYRIEKEADTDEGDNTEPVRRNVR
ncbi:MAG: hypothetical protein ACI4I6_07915 [Hominimerdicola sp.]